MKIALFVGGFPKLSETFIYLIRLLICTKPMFLGIKKSDKYLLFRLDRIGFIQYILDINRDLIML